MTSCALFLFFLFVSFGLVFLAGKAYGTGDSMKGVFKTVTLVFFAFIVACIDLISFSPTAFFGYPVILDKAIDSGDSIDIVWKSPDGNSAVIKYQRTDEFRLIKKKNPLDPYFDLPKIGKYLVKMGASRHYQFTKVVIDPSDPHAPAPTQ